MEVVTREDLEMFRTQIVNDLKLAISQLKPPATNIEEGYKTLHARKVLGCSVNKLVSLRINRKLRTKKIGGTIYYNKEDIKRLLEEGY